MNHTEVVVAIIVLVVALGWKSIETIVAAACIVLAILAFADENQRPRTRPSTADPYPAACATFTPLEDLDTEQPCKAAP